MIRDHITSERFGRLLLILSLSGSVSLLAQDPRDTLVEAAMSQVDKALKMQSLVAALNPALGPRGAAWSLGVQLLAQSLIEKGQDSTAAAWLRWAIRLSPDLQPDTVQFVPNETVASAYRSAREFVNHTRSANDVMTVTTWLWLPHGTGEGLGRIQATATAATVPVQVTVVDVVELRTGASVPLSPGSYDVRATAVGYDSARVVREVLPGVATVLDFRLRPAPFKVATAQQQPIVSAPKHKGFPWLLVAIGGGAAAGAAVLLGHGSPTTTPPPPGTITFPFPNP